MLEIPGTYFAKKDNHLWISQFNSPLSFIRIEHKVYSGQHNIVFENFSHIDFLIQFSRIGDFAQFRA